jgi:hypothetical protein
MHAVLIVLIVLITAPVLVVLSAFVATIPFLLFGFIGYAQSKRQERFLRRIHPLAKLGVSEVELEWELWQSRDRSLRDNANAFLRSESPAS